MVVHVAKTHRVKQTPVPATQLAKIVLFIASVRTLNAPIENTVCVGKL